MKLRLRDRKRDNNKTLAQGAHCLGWGKHTYVNKLKSRMLTTIRSQCDKAPVDGQKYTKSP